MNTKFKLTLAVLAGVALSTVAIQGVNAQHGCAADRPCFNGSYQAPGNKVVFEFTGVSGWDFYNVRYAKDGGEKQVENRSGSFTFNNVASRRVYKLKVQGCKSHTLARSTCSPWVEESVTTK
jgi:hypothetical protein